jgi:formyl-CoA transferase
VQYRRAPPLLGEHTEELLAEFGLSADQQAALKAQGALG